MNATAAEVTWRMVVPRSYGDPVPAWTTKCAERLGCKSVAAEGESPNLIRLLGTLEGTNRHMQIPVIVDGPLEKAGRHLHGRVGHRIRKQMDEAAAKLRTCNA